MNGAHGISRIWQRRVVSLAVLLSLSCWLGCKERDAETQVPPGSEVSVEAEHGHQVGHWSYHGDTGPEHWGDLDPAYSAAKDGREQSPIDIKSESAEVSELPAVTLAYESSVNLTVFNNGHAVRADVPDGGGSLTIGEETFKLLQFHFHAPSEHLVDGKEYAGEMHLVHSAEDGTLAVVGVFIVKGAAHAELAKIWDDLPEVGEDGHSKGEERVVAAFDLKKLLPSSLSSYRYAGSLTTPPCSEGVKWTVLAQPIEMSEEQIEAFVALFSGTEFPDGNRRPCQPLNGRAVLTDVK